MVQRSINSGLYIGLFLGGDSECLLDWRRFQALRDVVYKPGFGVIARFRGKYPEPSTIDRLELHGQ